MVAELSTPSAPSAPPPLLCEEGNDDTYVHYLGRLSYHIHHPLLAKAESAADGSDSFAGARRQYLGRCGVETRGSRRRAYLRPSRARQIRPASRSLHHGIVPARSSGALRS